MLPRRASLRRDGRGEGPPPEPAGYRTENYRAPTPATLAGARVLSTVAAERLWRDKAAVFIDVLPRAPRPANLPPGTIWRDKPRLDIPGSIWLPDTGYGELASVTEEYLRTNIERATGGDRTKLIVVYCLRDCWMSWNAGEAHPVDGLYQRRLVSRRHRRLDRHAAPGH